jgi:hypothetical protein
MKKQRKSKYDRWVVRAYALSPKAKGLKKCKVVRWVKR